MVAYPGRVNQDTVHYLLLGNVLAHDRLPMENSRGSFANVKASVLNITGSSDVLVTVACSNAMRERIGSEDATYKTIEAGHISIVSSARSQKETWGVIADWLLARDR